MKKTVFFIALSLFTQLILLNAQSSFINEVNYLANNPEEGVEIVGEAGQDLAGWSLVFYTLSGTIYHTENITNLIIPNKQNGYGSVWMEVSQSDEGGGVALINAAGSLVQFLSYGVGGALLTATEGIANGLTATLIGVQVFPENSLQLSGTGSEYSDFNWDLPSGTTPGEVNTGQTLIGLLPDLPDLMAAADTDGFEPAAISIEAVLYPNPVVEQVNLRFSLGLPDTGVIQLFDSSGRLVHTSTIPVDSYQAEVPAGDLPPGAYIIKLGWGKEQLIKRFIKR